MASYSRFRKPSCKSSEPKRHIIEVLRIAQMIERHGELNPHQSRLHRHEIEYCGARKAATQHYQVAGRPGRLFEALGTGSRKGISWRDIEVHNDPRGAPKVRLRGRVRRAGEERHP